jgi:hypothetical protein
MLNNKNFILVGSRGRILYKTKLYELFNKINSITMYNNICFKLIKKDYDYLYIGNQSDIINKYHDYIINIKKVYIKLNINKKIYDIFISNESTKYFYFLFLILGKQLTIILRNKAKTYNLKLNQYGLFYLNNLHKVPLRFNKTKDIFHNIYIIMKYIYYY